MIFKFIKQSNYRILRSIPMLKCTRSSLYRARPIIVDKSTEKYEKVEKDKEK